MTRHPATEGNDLKPNRVDAQTDMTVPDGQGGRTSVKDNVQNNASNYTEYTYLNLGTADDGGTLVDKTHNASLETVTVEFTKITSGSTATFQVINNSYEGSESRNDVLKEYTVLETEAESGTSTVTLDIDSREFCGIVYYRFDENKASAEIEADITEVVTSRPYGKP